jgi:hypothetical protein
MNHIKVAVSRAGSGLFALPSKGPAKIPERELVFASCAFRRV